MLYALARNRFAENLALLRLGPRFREFVERARTVPQDCVANRYSVLAHGVGVLNEYPSVPCLKNWEVAGTTAT